MLHSVLDRNIVTWQPPLQYLKPWPWRWTVRRGVAAQGWGQKWNGVQVRGDFRFRLRGPGQWFGRGGELSEWGCNPAVVPDETTVKTDKAKELLELLSECRYRPLCNLFRVCPQLPALNDATQELKHLSAWWMVCSQRDFVVLAETLGFLQGLKSLVT